MTMMSISQLASITGLDRRTVTQRLEKVDHAGGGKRGQAMTYETKLALPAIYLSGLVNETDTKLLDAKLERARLDRAKRHLAEAALAEKKGTLIPAKAVQEYWGSMVSNCRARLLAIPPKLGQRAIGITENKEITFIANTLIHEALMELSTEALSPRDDSR